MAEYREIAGTLRLPLEQVKLANVKMILLINPEHRSQVERHFKALRTAIKYYGLWYGAYPYEQVTLVDPPFRSGSGGMEYQTTIHGRHPGAAQPQENNPEMVIIHEFGHGYWYGLAASNEFEEAWLDEGINTYSTGKVLAKAYGPGSLPLTLFGIPLARYSGSLKYADLESDRAAAIQAVKYDPIATRFLEILQFHELRPERLHAGIDLPGHPGEPDRQGGHAADHARLPVPLPLPPSDQPRLHRHGQRGQRQGLELVLRRAVLRHRRMGLCGRPA